MVKRQVLTKQAVIPPQVMTNMVEKLAHIKQILLAEQPNMTNTAEKSVVINKYFSQLYNFNARMVMYKLDKFLS
jgi:division protein CdvB (Snf7/Vps24/ESCRT-III family)